MALPLRTDPSEADLDAWMARLADGDRAAFDPLFRALHPRALRLARARLGDDRAVEAAQSSMVKLFARASDFEAGRAVLPWFYAVVANEVRAQTRARTTCDRRDAGEGEIDRVAANGDPERALLDRELRRALDQAIATLDAEAIDAIEAVLGLAPRPPIAPPAFRKRVSRIYARLRLLLGGPHGE